MTDLRAFIEARLAEDESVALAASGSTPRLQKAGFSAHWHTEPWYDGTGERCDLRAGVAGDLTVRGGIEVPSGEHAARHDPARVLREVAAKRAILKRHARTSRGYCDGCGYQDCDEPLVEDAEECPELRTMASIFADHPDYNPSWSTA